MGKTPLEIGPLQDAGHGRRKGLPEVMEALGMDALLHNGRNNHGKQIEKLQTDNKKRTPANLQMGPMA